MFSCNRVSGSAALVLLFVAVLTVVVAQRNTTEDAECAGGDLEVRCADGPCIPADWLCDGLQDCPEADDELDCDATTTADTTAGTSSDTTTAESTTETETTTESTTAASTETTSGELTDPASESTSASTSTTETTEGTTTEAASTPTTPEPACEEFRCTVDGPCIPLSWVCDGLPDCDNNRDEDEVRCPENAETTTTSGTTTEITTTTATEATTTAGSSTTSESTTTAPSTAGTTTTDRTGEAGECIPGSQDQFRCGRNPRHCIPLSWVCDGFIDCTNQRDERGCPDSGNTTTSPAPESSTAATSAVTEVTTPVVGECAPRGSELARQQFRCSRGGPCILREWLCDGVRDCPNGRDEHPRRCGDRTTTTAPTTTTTSAVDASCDNPRNTFKCTLTGPCLPPSWLCDTIMDCENGRDERKCTTTAQPSTVSTTQPMPRKCNDREFTCLLAPPGTEYRCISSRKVCDGVVDCPGNTDEIRCPTTTTVSSTTESEGTTTPAGPHESCDDPRNTFRCTRRGPCIPREFVCDGIRDCPNDRDESRCVTTPRPTTPPSCLEAGPSLHVMCPLAPADAPLSIRCIPVERVCNGVVDCPLGTDELRCPTTTTHRPTTRGGRTRKRTKGTKKGTKKGSKKGSKKRSRGRRSRRSV